MLVASPSSSWAGAMTLEFGCIDGNDPMEIMVNSSAMTVSWKSLSLRCSLAGDPASLYESAPPPTSGQSYWYWCSRSWRGNCGSDFEGSSSLTGRSVS
jgi:hypothetical protein